MNRQRQASVFPSLPDRRTLRPVDLLRCVKWLAAYGPQGMMRKLRLHKHRYAPLKRNLSARALSHQRRERFPQEISFHIVLCVDEANADEAMIAIRCLQQQTYARWTLQPLCSEALFTQLREASGSDSRIVAEPPAAYDYLLRLHPSDRLHPGALNACMHAVCNQHADFIYTDEDLYRHAPCDLRAPLLKADFSAVALLGYNYIGRFFVCSKALAKLVCVDMLAPAFHADDAVLRLCHAARHVAHIPQILLYRQENDPSLPASDAQPYCQAVQAHLDRCHQGAKASPASHGCVHVQWPIAGEPMISILIPNKDHSAVLERCIASIASRSTWQKYEIIIIENNSLDPVTFALYEQLQQRYDHVRVVTWHGGYNFAAINNFGAQFAEGDYLLLLNNDVEVISPSWMEEMLMYAQREETGAVGALLLYPNGTVQHAGVATGVTLMAGHLHRGFDGNASGYMNRLCYAQHVTALTAACMMMRASVFNAIQGFDERYAVAFNDIDLCLRLREAGYLNVFTPFARLYHYESLSRGPETTSDKRDRFLGETERFHAQWEHALLQGDPYYNVNLSPLTEDFRPRA